jgi:hypothetical protein
VLVPATLVANPSRVVYSQTVVVTGTHFGASEPVRTYWDSPASAPLTSTVSTSTGTFHQSIVVPQTISGAHVLIAIGQTSGISATASLAVKPSLVAGNATLGVPARIQGFGFGPNERVKVWWNTTPPMLLGTASATSAGSFVLTCTPAATGTHVLYAVGQTTHAVGRTVFTVAAGTSTRAHLRLARRR